MIVADTGSILDTVLESLFVTHTYCAVVDDAVRTGSRRQRRRCALTVAVDGSIRDTVSPSWLATQRLPPSNAIAHGPEPGGSVTVPVTLRVRGVDPRHRVVPVVRDPEVGAVERDADRARDRGQRDRIR